MNRGEREGTLQPDAELGWDHPNGRNEKHVKAVNTKSLPDQIIDVKNDLNRLSANGGSKKDKIRCKKHLRHLWAQLHARGEEHSRLAKNQYQRKRR